MNHERQNQQQQKGGIDTIGEGFNNHTETHHNHDDVYCVYFRILPFQSIRRARSLEHCKERAREEEHARTHTEDIQPRRRTVENTQQLKMKNDRTPRTRRKKCQRCHSLHGPTFVSPWTLVLILALICGGLDEKLRIWRPKFTANAFLVPTTTTTTTTTTTPSRIVACGQRTSLFAIADPFVSSSFTNQTSKYDVSSSTSSLNKKSGVAIVINGNAGGVTSDILATIQEKFSPFDESTNTKIYITKTLEEAQQATRDIITQNPALVVPMGGDGTLTMCIESLLAEQQKQSSALFTLPMFGYVALGTGNALGTVIGCTPQSQWKADGTGRKRGFLKSLVQPRKTKRENLIETLQRLIDLGQSLDDENADDIMDPSTHIPNGETKNTDLNTMMDFVDLPLMEMTSYRKCISVKKKKNSNNKLSIQQDKHYCFFAGVGFDSMMLQDYQDLQEWSKQNQFWKERLGSVFGYCVTLVTKTLPKCLGIIESDIDSAYYGKCTSCGDDEDDIDTFCEDDDGETDNVSNNQIEEKKMDNNKNKKAPYLVDVKITTNQPDGTVWIDHRRGDVVRRVVSSPTEGSSSESSSPTLLYKGIAGIVAGSTTPYYGGNLKLFPFARMSLDKMQLRVGRIHPMTGVLNLKGIFRGSYRDLRSSSFGCIDFLSKQFTIEIDDSDGGDDDHELSMNEGQVAPNATNKKQKKGYPVQHSGESIGACHRIDLQVLPEPIRFVTLLPPRIIHEEKE